MHLRSVALVLILIALFGYGTLLLLSKKSGNAPDSMQQTGQAVPNKPLEDADKRDFPQARQSSHRLLFVPYWGALNQDKQSEMDYDEYAYFGVTQLSEGMSLDSREIDGLDSFNKLKEGSRSVVVKAFDTPEVRELLENKQKRTIAFNFLFSSLAAYNLDSVLLDLEINISINANMTNYITSYVQDFCTQARRNYKSCSLIVYGDVFYRLRPYDIKELQNHVDSFWVMLYDFHKAGGEPGPNFPLVDDSQYGYDLARFIADWNRVAGTLDNIGFIFGMYGYNWTVDEKGRPIKPATASSLNEIRKLIADNGLSITRNTSEEPSVRFTDGLSKDHIIWFEDEESIERKQQYLKERGIRRFGWWAYSYF